MSLFIIMTYIFCTLCVDTNSITMIREEKEQGHLFSLLILGEEELKSDFVLHGRKIKIQYARGLTNKQIDIFN